MIEEQMNRPRFKPGDRVKMTDEARRMFRGTKRTSGTVLRIIGQGKYVVIVRDGLKTEDSWALDFWEKE
jgi:hypothetical protein